MNSNSQLDLHPDAESLNAFLERALPEQERGQILAHIAVCNQCRQVVFLAQEAVPALAVPTARAAAQHTPGPGFRWTSWRFAWLPATALAAVVALAIFVHLRRAEQSVELAKLAPLVTLQNKQSASNLHPQEPGKTSTAVAHESPMHSAEDARSRQIRPRSESPSAEAVAPVVTAAKANDKNPNAGGNLASLPPTASGQLYAASQFESEPTAKGLRPPSYSGADSSNSATAQATEASRDSLEEREQASRTSSAAVGGLQLQTAPASRGDFEVTAPSLTAKRSVIRKAKATPLPSGLISVSTATGQLFILSLDQAGTLFLSEDAGRNWEPVAMQWNGRAIQVRIQQAYNSVGGASAEPATEVAEDKSKDSAARAPALSTAVFEIVNDNNQIWVSTNGKNWKAK